ncbi:CLUMA_CG003676, isoform A [Clunio marinus]|uniref:DNA mismatch repair protein n=1 Tax=Clunio marinus TaxID=568069 RepID=A0A1J1HPQ5_9DIPT|nr:CLUMA_CG003676, isoform A [Clunio marinus]
MSNKKKTTPKPSPKNTLFSYFTKNPPKTPVNIESEELKESSLKVEEETPKVLKGKKLEFGKRSSLQDSSDEEEINKNPSKKRRIVDSSEDEDQDTENTDLNKSSSDDVKKTIKRSFTECQTESKFPTPKVSKKTETCKKDSEPATAEKDALLMVDNLNKVWVHEELPFLQPDKIRDKNKNRPNHPDYDPRTVYVPQDFIEKQTPAMAQWWTLKSGHFDCIFFFKVGKFYELYHHDAIVGVKELGFTFMGKDNHAHSGFPESAYEKMASILVERGYKVARVEQTENPAMMEERCKREGTKGKFARVMKREVCQITDRGTQIFTSGQQKMNISSDPHFMLTIAESKVSPTQSRYGICFIDTTIGDFTIGEFEDDQQCSRLLTLLSHYMPVLLLHDRKQKAQHTEKIIKALNVLKEPLTDEKQMWNGQKTLKYMYENIYSNDDKWPECLKKMQEDHLKPLEGCELALKALGGCLWYLERNLLVKQILSLATFKRYFPPDQTMEVELKNKKNYQKSMVLDNITLSNLNVVGKDASLFSKMDFCCTQFGKRLLMEYLCTPTTEIKEIRGRQEAVKELYGNVELLQDCRGILSCLNIDLERSLAQIHQIGNREAMKDHPDSRAILYETQTYGKNRISDFAALLKALDLIMDLPKIFENCNSKLLKLITQTKENGGNFENMSKEISKIKNAFDIEAALKSGFAVPEKNADPEYDSILDGIDELEVELREYLKEQEKIFGCKLSYFGTDRKRYQIEVPESKAKNASSSYQLESTKKGKDPLKRYVTDETKDFLKRMQQLEEQKKNCLNDFARKVFGNFSINFSKYKTIASLVAKLDVLAAFAEYARNQNVVCVPEVHEMSETAGKSLLKIENGIHPLMNADDFIPNGIDIPSNGKAFFELITGPNMGGKSTLMREVALLCIMAQTGCMVPADSMELSIVDRIFTRLGANDNIMANQSTFLVELNETSLILKHCTHNSLVLLDELGRGTSTYDGTAIARSVANFLANMKCRTLFSTHYHNLVDSFYGDERIRLGHMACMVENENSDDITKENVTFLYKYTTGSCPKSFGFNAAKLAGIQLEIIRRAHEISKQMEAETLKRKITSKILQNGNTEEVKNLVAKFKSCYV